MASVYKLGRDTKMKHAPWYIMYFDHNGQRKTVKGFTDKSKTEQLASKLEHEAQQRRTGLIDPQQEELANQKRSGIESHLQDFESSLSRRKNTSDHVKRTMGRIRRIIEGCEFKKLGDLAADTVECFLAELCIEEDLGHRTHNHYVQAFEQFCAWLFAKKRLVSNPVTALHRQNCQTDVRRKRRALSTEEFAKLLKAARTSKETIQCFDGVTRGLIYTLSFMTGLRRGEIASLTPNSFKLEGTLATVTIEASNSKRRKLDVLPLHPELVLMLREWLKEIPPDEFLFPKLAKRRTWLMVKKDLEKAGIPYITPEGIADFHAAGRHSFITGLLRNGATLPEAKELARHSDVNMTMRYTHIGIEDQARALTNLPNPCQHIVSIPGDFEGQTLATPVSDGQHNEETGVDVKPCPVSLCDTEKQKESSGDSPDDSWRRGELNPRPVVPQPKPLRA